MDERVYKRLRWRARRGTQELDRLLLPFLEETGSEWSAEALEHFERLLAVEDDHLQDWLINGRKPTDGALDELVGRIRQHAGLPPAG